MNILLRIIVIALAIIANKANAQQYWLVASSSGSALNNNTQMYLNLSITSTQPAAGSVVLFGRSRDYGGTTTTVYLYGVPASLKIYGRLGQLVGTITLTSPATISNVIKLNTGIGYSAGVKFAEGTLLGAVWDMVNGQWRVAYVGGGYVPNMFNAIYSGGSGNCGGTSLSMADTGDISYAMMLMFAPNCTPSWGLPNYLYWSFFASST